MRLSLFFAVVLVAVPGLADAQLGQRNPGDAPSVSDASIPMTYVGGDTRVSIGLDNHGNTQGELMGVFGDNGARAVVGQLWWANGGAGGLQFDYNWLWGMTAQDAKDRPDDITVARTTIALDQNAQHDRKATFGVGIARPNYYVDAYLSAAASGRGNGGGRSSSVESMINGEDAIGSYTQTQVTTLSTLFDERPYRAGIGMRAGHFSDAWTARGFGGLEYQTGAQGAHETTVSLGVDKYLGVHGWSVTGLAEHSQSSGPVDGRRDDNRFSVLLRYEFGGHGIFVPRGESATPAWVARSLREPTSSHPRTVSTYRTIRSVDTATTLRPDKRYTNRAAIAADDSATVAVNSRDNPIDVLGNDSDPDADVLTITGVGAPSHGSAALAGGVINYTPAAGYTGTDRFNYTISDGHGHAATANVTVTIMAAPNVAPIARDDTATSTNGQPVRIVVLANDTDPDGDAFTVTAIGSPENGFATRNADGSVTYTPNSTFAGTDRFTYTISDSQGRSSTAEVVVTVTGTSDRAPRARDDAATTAYGQPVTIAVLANDTDPDRDALSVRAVGSPANGTASRNVDNTLTYTPNPTFSGSDSFTYTISDRKGQEATATVTVTVLARPDQPPIAVNDAATTAFAQPVRIAVLANDSDPDGDALMLAGVGSPSNGTATVNTDGSVTYTPSASFSGTDRFTYTVSDGRGLTATATVTVVVRPNFPPLAVDDTTTIAFGQPVRIAVLANDSDPESDALVLSAVGSPPNGTAAANTDGTITYAPGANFSGTDRFTYTISDGHGNSASATVTIAVLARPNRPPVASADVAQIRDSATDVNIPVLNNDSDPDGDSLSIVRVTQPSQGTVTVKPDGTLTYKNAQPAFVGDFPFTYTISDGHGLTATGRVVVSVYHLGPARPDGKLDR